MNVDRLVEQAREYCSGAMRKQGEALVAGLADAVEQLERDRQAWETAWFRDTDQLSEEADEARARVAALEASLKNIALARCLGDIRPPGCSGTCVTCEARAALEGTVSEVRVGAIAEMRERVAALEAAMRDHDDCRVCCALLDLVPSTGQETT